MNYVLLKLIFFGLAYDILFILNLFVDRFDGIEEI